MRVNLRIVLIFITIAALAGTASAIDVFVSNPAEGAIYRIAGGAATEVYSAVGARFENLVIDPKGMLIACDPDAGRIIRFDPAAPGTPGTVFVATSGDALQQPQCGWIGANGDLFVADESAGAGVFRLAYDALSDTFGAPAPVLAGADFGAAFVGGGVTQAANGDLLVADRASGQVWALEIDLYTGDFLPATQPTVLISGLSDPVGIARSSNGTIWVATRNHCPAEARSTLG